MGALSEREDEWGRRATAAAIAAARRLVLGEEAAVNMNTPVGRLSDIEWGWIISSAIFGWIATRAEQAVAEGLDTESVIHTANSEALDAGVVAAILPKLSGMTVADWSQPIAAWPRETMIRFLLAALDLIRTAMRARDLSNSAITRKAGSDEPDDLVPFFS